MTRGCCEDGERFIEMLVERVRQLRICCEDEARAAALWRRVALAAILAALWIAKLHWIGD